MSHPSAAPVSRLARLSARAGGALLISVLAGLLVAAVALPVVAGAGMVARDQVEEYLVLPADLELPTLNQRTQVLAADGSVLASLYLENRVPVELDEVPEHTQQAVLAIEDSRFYEHPGFDVKGTLRAAVRNGLSGSVQQGGSTLTQQYVKNALIAAAETPEEQARAREASIERKLQEARYALALEREMPKDEILRRYLNIAYYGNGAYGIGTAATLYFGKPVSELTVPEGALLAGLVQSPSRHDPVRNPEQAVERRDTVLARMAEVGFLTPAQQAEAAATPLALDLQPVGSGCEAAEVTAPFFCDYIRRVLEEGPLGAALGDSREERQQRLLGGGLTVRTTLHPGIQATAQYGLDTETPRQDPSGVASVFTAVEPGTGHVLALAVNRDFGEDDQPGATKLNLALGGSSGMQGGSTFKPFVLADALRQGLPLDTTFDSPGSYESDVFVNCNGNDCDDPYVVRNAGDSSAGLHDMVSGTRNSVNTYYLQLFEQTGVDGPAQLAEDFGFRQFANGRPTAPLHRGGSFVLGVNEVSPLDMSAAYATFAARGTYCPPRPVVSIVDANGQDVPLPAQECRQVLDPAITDTVTSILRGTVDGPWSRTARRASIGRPVAGKTGSTNGSQAAWFAGYTPQLASSVWVGTPVPTPLRDVTINGQYYRQVYGGTLPAPIWGSIMGHVLRDAPVAELPAPAVSNPQRPDSRDRSSGLDLRALQVPEVQIEIGD